MLKATINQSIDRAEQVKPRCCRRATAATIYFTSKKDKIKSAQAWVEKVDSARLQTIIGQINKLGRARATRYGSKNRAAYTLDGNRSLAQWHHHRRRRHWHHLCVVFIVVSYVLFYMMFVRYVIAIHGENVESMYTAAICMLFRYIEISRHAVFKACSMVGIIVGFALYYFRLLLLLTKIWVSNGSVKVTSTDPNTVRRQTTSCYQIEHEDYATQVRSRWKWPVWLAVAATIAVV